MMEESGDDANGDSTFEFVAVRDSVPQTDEASKLQAGDDAPHPTTPLEAPAPAEPSLPAKKSTESVIPQPAANPQTPVAGVTSVQPLMPAAIQPPAPSVQLSERFSAPIYPPAPTMQQPFGAAHAVPPMGHQGATMYAPTSPPQGPPPPYIAQTYHAAPGYSTYCSYEAHTPAGSHSLALSLPTDYEPQAIGGTFVSSDQSNPGGMWGWFRGSDFLSKVAEKAKNSVDSVITTLDPGMKEYIYSGGDIGVIVASDKEVKVVPVREAFQRVFGRASVTGVAAQPSNMAVQPVGFAAGLKAAEDRIISLQQAGRVQPGQPIIAVESFLVELTPDCWYDIACLVLRDDSAGINLHTFSQATPVPAAIASELQDRTPPDYPLRWSGFSVTVGEVAGLRLGVTRTQWHQVIGGIPRSQLLLSTACTLATMYKTALHR